jgi:hypothetical protein
MLSEWYSRALPRLAPTPREWLAKLVCAVVEAGACTQPALATALQRLHLSGATNESVQVAIRRWLSDERVSAETAYAPLVQAVLAAWPAETLLVIVDLTTLKDRLIRLQVSLAYHGRGVPLSWAVYPASGVPAGTTWLTLFTAALSAAQAVLPRGRRVVVVLDRGFTSPAVWDAVRAHGWHPLLRALRTVHLRTAEGHEQELGTLLGDDPGLVALAGAVFKKAGWREATVTAMRQDGMTESWLLLSDLPAGLARATEYAIRMHIEQSFRDEKGHGWQWEQSRITDPARASRLLLVLHLASLWCLSAGAVAMQTGRARQWVRLSRPAWSLFRLGRAWLRHALMQPEAIPLAPRFPLVPTWRTSLLAATVPLHA